MFGKQSALTTSKIGLHHRARRMHNAKALIFIMSNSSCFKSSIQWKYSFLMRPTWRLFFTTLQPKRPSGLWSSPHRRQSIIQQTVTRARRQAARYGDHVCLSCVDGRLWLTQWYHNVIPPSDTTCDTTMVSFFRVGSEYRTTVLISSLTWITTITDQSKETDAVCRISTFVFCQT